MTINNVHMKRCFMQSTSINVRVNLCNKSIHVNKLSAFPQSLNKMSCQIRIKNIRDCWAFNTLSVRTLKKGNVTRTCFRDVDVKYRHTIVA